jgi:outer membrane lipoprotein-sorting protein
MEPYESSESLEARLKALPLRRPSADFGQPEKLRALLRHSDQLTLITRIRTMNRISKSAILAALAASIAAIAVFTVGSAGSTVAFAQVAQKLQKARTLTFDETLVSQADGKLLRRSRNYYMIPGKTRTETSADNDENGYIVFDTVAAKVLMVDSKRKTARISSIKGGEQKDMAARKIEDLQNLKAEDARPLGNKVVDGVQAKGFEITRPSDVTTVWADATTGEPVRIEILRKTFPSGPVVETWTNFKFDPPLNDALFSVEPPAGYQSQPSLPVDFNLTPAEVTAKFLKIYADHMGGEFPPRLQDAMKLLSEKMKKDTTTPSTEEAAQTAFYASGMAAVIMKLEQGKGWQYYLGRKLGDKDKVVFWVNDKASGGYLAVYGDLRVETITKEALSELKE